MISPVLTCDCFYFHLVLCHGSACHHFASLADSDAHVASVAVRVIVAHDTAVHMTGIRAVRADIAAVCRADALGMSLVPLNEGLVSNLRNFSCYGLILNHSSLPHPSVPLL